MTLNEALQEGSNRLRQAGILEYALDAMYLLLDACNINKATYILNKDVDMQQRDYDLYKQWIEKRKNKKPLQYILGYQEFMGMTFKVNENVLIPRQDTEVLVELCLKYIKEYGVNAVLDMCTGSGCIAISLKSLSNVQDVTAVDISSQAIEVARQNAIDNHQCVHFIKSDLFHNVAVKKYDLIVSNPPYIPTEEINNLAEEVKIHEPRLALDGSHDGLMFYRKIIADAKNYLNSHGWVFVEIGYNQGQDVSNIFYENGYVNIHVKEDMAGLERVVYAMFSNGSV